MRLVSRREAIGLLASAFASTESGNAPATLLLEVREGRCFTGGQWLCVGTITVFPGSAQDGDTALTAFENAILFGAYEWQARGISEVMDDLQRLTDTDGRADDKGRLQLEKVVESLAHAAVRCGLLHPIFDANEVAEMPFRRPCTIVVDTSAVIQGGLDFAVRFLCPAARIKVPALVHMEIVNLGDNFLKQRRSGKAKSARMLLGHVISQGAQRALLRLELQAETEVERPRLGADPLRGIVQPASDQEDKNLGLQEVQRSFADRLILETAIQQQDRLSPGHTVFVLTCDEGLARMSLSEGLRPLFFRAVKGMDISFAALPGTRFAPFGQARRGPLMWVPLPVLLWELAITFGSARIRDPHSMKAFRVSAMDEDLIWQPYHARDDLLWVRETDTEESSSTENIPRAASEVSAARTARLHGAYEAWPQTMLTLLKELVQGNMLTDEKAMRVLGLSSARSYRDYRNFLAAGGFVRREGNAVVPTDALSLLWEAIRRLDLRAAGDLLRRVPSFGHFVSELKMGKPVQVGDVRGMSVSAFPAYRAWTEIIGEGLGIAGEGLYATPASPTLEEFAEWAIDSFQELSGGDGFVLTGQWLEALARRFGVHPLTSRERLAECVQFNQLERFTEGSSPETRFERHVMANLLIEQGEPVVQQVNLYRGDFLVPGRASVRIRLERRTK